MSARPRVPFVCLLACRAVESVILSQQPAPSPGARVIQGSIGDASAALTRSGKLIAPHQGDASGRFRREAVRAAAIGWRGPVS